MPQSYFPLRWESTGDQWWYASPIDWAAANGHYDLVRELLHLDANLLIKLTSLRRIRRLETVWDDDTRFVDAAKCRSFVARNLLLECETKNRKNTLIRAGYGGWLLYTAASAGDISFVRELLERAPLLVFGEGEYGVTDILYAAARSKNSEVFRLLFEIAASPKSLVGGSGGEVVDGSGGCVLTFKLEMVNRAVHAAARGGNLEILKELLEDCSDILAYRDVQGSTILHAAAGRGQVEVVKDLVASYDIINSRDNQGNTALHVAAFRGHLSVVEALITASPSSSTLTNNAGDTFLHMAVAGFRTPGFRRLDRQMELMKKLVCGTIVNMQEIINVRNNDGRTALHMAVIGNMHSNLVELLMTVQSINLNIRDTDCLTPLDLLRQRPRSASSEILIKQLISAGGVSNSKDYMARSAIASHIKLQGIGNSPGTSFRISDAEIFLHAGIEASEASGRPSSCSSVSRSELPNFGTIDENQAFSDKKKQNPVNSAARRLMILLRWPRRKEKKTDTPKKLGDDDSLDSLKKWSEREETPTPLRQRFSRGTSLLNNKRTLSVRSSVPSPATKKKFAAGLMHGVIQTMPHLAPPTRYPSGSFPESSMSSPSSDKQKGICGENEPSGGASCSNSSVTGGGTTENTSQKSGFVNARLMNQYLCFGAQGLTVEDSVNGQRSSRTFKRSVLSVA
ncbi:serine/threonine-protein phosphatase 6 regulatory ankyrin repeat subunit C-like [Phoenix dactylifera]|uniref:Serine/threonine-protein phosphatase 6 regulatory ankyrin repeat subunit C-like n=1 Tax=Phoenix dactylifera TaxID=42345 RepID=A0A8B7C5Q2_PHODC|nr:serine/threonine-protein phosphatase 6 regulatory ankyrin repeat subunit C-like [Phoenix dactylifera]